MDGNATGDDRRERGSSTRDDAIEYAIEGDEAPGEAVVRAVATLTHTPVLDLDPLYHSIDPDHLDGLFDDPDGRGPTSEPSITITFNGCRVTVTRDLVRARRFHDEDG